MGALAASLNKLYADLKATKLTQKRVSAEVAQPPRAGGAAAAAARPSRALPRV